MEHKEKKKMATDIKVFIVVCAVIVVILAAAVVYLVTPKDIATVENGKVSNNEFRYYFTQNVQYVMQYAGTGTDQATLLDTAKQMALSQAIEVEYLLLKANAEGFKPDQKELNESWATMEKNINESAATSELSVKDFCKQAVGVTLNQFKEIFADNYKAQKYRETKIDGLTVDDAELTAFYEENKASLDYNEVRHILITIAKDAEQTVIDEKNKAAQDILDRVNKGEDFAALAKEFSEDPGSKDTGGLYQVQQNGQYVPEFEEWAFSHKTGETGIVKTDYGLHIMKMENIYDSLEAQKDKVTNYWKSNKYSTELNEVMNDGTLKIEILDGYNEFQF